MCGCLLHAPYWRPGLQHRHVLWTGNQIGDTLICRLVFSPLSHTSKGSLPNFYLGWIKIHVDVGLACSTSPSLLPVWMDMVPLIL